MLRRIIDIAILAVAWVLVVVGVIIAPIPIPIGQAMALLGLSILVHRSPAMRRRIRRFRGNRPKIDAYVRRWHGRVPGFIRRLIDETDPGSTEDGPDPTAAPSVAPARSPVPPLPQGAE